MMDFAGELARLTAEREEKSLKGAWMAGYSYLHVFKPMMGADQLGQYEPDDTLTFKQPVYLPSNTARNAADIGAYRYAYTYDIDSVPDRKILYAIERSA